jgi:3',5'-cyclic-AMP phosphodiesterase
MALPDNGGIMGGAARTLIQIGDLHVGATWTDVDPLRRLTEAIDSVLAMDVHLDAVLVLGDLAEHGTDREYELAAAQLRRLPAPVYVAMGNHDDRAGLRRCFGLGTPLDAPVHYVADLGYVRLIVLDSTIPGADTGELDEHQLAWLSTQLARAGDAPTVLAIHHPPMLTGAPELDNVALSDDSRWRLARVIEAHPQIQQILAAHLHRPLVAACAQRPLLVAPSTYAQFPFQLSSGELKPTDEASGYVVHRIADSGELTSFFHAVPARLN